MGKKPTKIGSFKENLLKFQRAKRFNKKNKKPSGSWEWLEFSPPEHDPVFPAFFFFWSLFILFYFNFLG